MCAEVKIRDPKAAVFVPPLKKIIEVFLFKVKSLLQVRNKSINEEE
jgi:hypothetical protein